MTEYALLILPSANRVYAEAAVGLTVAELEVLNASVLGGRLTDFAPTTIGGVPYVAFAGPELTDREFRYLAMASARYALFERAGDLLRPLPLPNLDRLDDDLVTIPKYPGKTNEQFTKLLLNVTLLSSASAEKMLDSRLRVLDPLCGRGTTLNQALTYGYDAAGMDLDGKDFDAYTAFLKTYLKRKRIKHRAEVAPVRREKKLVARRLTVTLTPPGSAEALNLDVLHADSTAAPDFFKGESFDAIVADAPYGVQHGSRTVTAGLRRTPIELLDEAVPGWARLMRRGAAIGISWNTHVASRDEAAKVLAESGLRVLEEGPYARFRHRVDQSIDRDVIVACKA